MKKTHNGSGSQIVLVQVRRETANQGVVRPGAGKLLKELKSSK